MITAIITTIICLIMLGYYIWYAEKEFYRTLQIRPCKQRSMQMVYLISFVSIIVQYAYGFYFQEYLLLTLLNGFSALVLVICFFAFRKIVKDWEEWDHRE